jgi:hypothetical protein
MKVLGNLPNPKWDLNALVQLPSTQFHGTNMPHVFLNYMFQSDGAIFRYIGVLQPPVSLSAALPTLASVYTLGVRCMYGLYMPCVVKCIAYWISKILKYYVCVC